MAKKVYCSDCKFYDLLVHTLNPDDFKHHCKNPKVPYPTFRLKSTAVYRNGQEAITDRSGIKNCEVINKSNNCKFYIGRISQETLKRINKMIEGI